MTDRTLVPPYSSTAIPTVIITGASSGVGLHGAKALAARGWFVVMACRDVDKGERTAPEGYEISVATNHVGHFLLANLLLPTLE